VATWLAGPLGRVRAIIEGIYPASPVAGRSVTAGRFTRADYRGDPYDLNWPGPNFHNAYLLNVDESGDREGDPVNRRAGAAREEVLVTVRVGYVIAPDGRIARGGCCADEDTATQLGHEDHHALREALRWPAFWADTTPSIAQIRPVGRVATAIVVPRRRVYVSSRYTLTLSYAPGSTWT
jgi:hypothetical protein